MKKTVTLNLGAALVKFLQQQYIRRDNIEHRLINGVFGIFGHGNVTGFGQALEEFGGAALPYYQPKNEQGMVHTAIAFAKARKRLGTFACTTSVGPGATNLITGAATATVNRLPVLLLPGDTFAKRIPGPVLQQLEYPGNLDTSVNDCFRPVSKFWDRINRPEQILTSLPEAMRILCDPAETGAVTICMPEDVQAESYAYPLHLFEKRVYTIERPGCSAEALRNAVALIKSAHKPLIVAGGGVHYSDATAALEKLADLGIPVGVTQAGKGALLGSHPSALDSIGTTGGAAANQIAADADLVINIGTRLSDFTTASKSAFQNPRVRFISINVNAFDAHKHGALPLVGDARTIINQLVRALAGWKVSPAYRDTVRRTRENWAETRAAIMSPKRGFTITQPQVIDELNKFVGAEGVMVHAAGGLPGDVHKLWHSNGHDDYHSEYGYSCMGYEIAGALGVKMADPKREVYAFLGDGSYLMLHTELVTAVQEGQKITIVLVDNHGYACIHNLQRGSGGNSFGNEFRLRERGRDGRLEGKPVPVDFVKNAESLGAKALSATNVEEFRAALAAAKKEKGCVLIYLPVSPDFKVPGFSWWEVPVSGTSKVPGVRAARKAYERALKKQQFYY